MIGFTPSLRSTRSSQVLIQSRKRPALSLVNGDSTSRTGLSSKSPAASTAALNTRASWRASVFARARVRPAAKARW